MERGLHAIIIKPILDSKAGESVLSRLGLEKKVDVLIGRQEDVQEVLSQYCEKNGDIDCVLVDEAQFLTRQQVDDFFEYAVKKEVPVICYGLRTDFQTKGFEGSTRLLELAHTLEELKTICRCGKKAVFNGRKKDGRFIFEGDQVSIDGENSITYESLCAKCYFDLQKGEK